MTLVVYKCDVCKREKQYIQNPDGLETIQRCTITHGCRGKLFQTDLHPDYIRSSTPRRVLGLDEWRQRKVLYNHTQSIARDEWLVEHNLGTFPSVSVFINIPIEGDLENTEEVIPTDTVVVDENNLLLKFDRPWAGLAQLVARQSDPNLLQPYTRVVEAETTLQQISNGGEIAIATRVSSIGESSDISLVTRYTTTQNTIIDNTYTVSDTPENDSTSSWADFNKVVKKVKIYTVRSYECIIMLEMVDDNMRSGSTFSFTGIIDYKDINDTRERKRDEVYILFVSTPFPNSNK